MSVRIDHGVTAGTFSLDGETFDVDNNVWVIGDDDQCIVLDAPHDVKAIREVISGRRVLAIVCTHAHDDHVRVAQELADAVDTTVLLHPDDLVLWHQVHSLPPGGELRDGQRLSVGDVELTVLHTPGHSPGPAASTPSSSGWCSPATPCSAAVLARPAAASPTATPSWRRSGTGCSRCLLAPW